MIHKARTKALSWLLSLAMLFSLVPGMSLTALAEGEHVHDGITFIEWTDALAAEQNGTGNTAANSLPKTAGSYFLTTNVTLNNTWYVSVDGTINLCLNGHSIQNMQNSAIWVTGATDYSTGETQPAHLNLYDEAGNTGSITGNVDPNYGGCGGGVYVGNGGMFTMYGGRIINSSAPTGGGVYVAAGGTFTMNGGSITGNTANIGGGVFLEGGDDWYASATMNLSGNITIKDNSRTDNTESPSNIYLGKGDGDRSKNAKITITGALTGSDSIGVSAGASGVFTSGWSTYMTDAEPESVFTIVGDYNLATTADGELKLARPPVSYLDWDGEKLVQKTCDDYDLITDETNHLDSGWYVIKGNIEPMFLEGNPRFYGASTDLHIILCDGAKLTSSISAQSSAGNVSLTVYAQSEGENAGSMDLAGPMGGITIGAVNANLTINGGNITSSGIMPGPMPGPMLDSAGIEAYDSDDALNASVTINGGTVNAVGTAYGILAAGVTINGGVVSTYGGEKGIDGDITLGSSIFLCGGSSPNPTDVVQKNEDGSYPTSSYMVTGTHTHALTYSAKGAVVSAHCANKDGKCMLPNQTATLTIGAPEEANGPAVLTASAEGVFGNLSNIPMQYSSTKTESGWTNFSDTQPTAEGFHAARFTYQGQTATVTYGISCIAYGTADNGTVSGVTTAAVGASITPTVTPNPGYELKELTVKYTDGDTPITVTNGSFTMPEANVTVGATFQLKTYTITDASTNGSVTVTGTPQEDETITLSATPATGYEFVSYSVKNANGGDVDVTSDNGTYTFTMPASDVTVTATFQLHDYTITKGTIQNGSVTVKKGEAEASTAKMDEEVTLIATPHDGYALASYTVSDGTNPITVTDGKFTMPASDVTVTAAFDAIDYSITLTQPEIGGTINASQTTGTVGNEITLSATAAAGYALESYTASDGANEITVTDGKFTMPAANVTVSATFAPIDYTVTVSEMTHGTVVADKTNNAHIGNEIALTVTPDEGYMLDTLTVSADGSTNAITVTGGKFTMPAANVTVSATFKLKDFAINSNLTPGTMTATVGTDTVTTAKMGDSVTLTITPAAGYTVNTVSVKNSAGGDVDVTSGSGSYSFTMPASDVTVTATYNAIDYSVTVSAAEHGSVAPSKTSAANVGETITLTITPNDGYSTGSVSVKDSSNADVTVSGTGNTCSFTMPASDVTVSATFTPIDYTVTIANTANGTVTTSTTGAVHIGDKVTLTVTPDVTAEHEYGLKTITTTSGTLVQTALDPDTGVVTYELTMDAANATVTATFTELTTYTVFYNASNAPSAVSVKLAGGEQSYPMAHNAKLDNIDCWSTQLKSGKGVGALTLLVKQSDAADWRTLTISVVSSIPTSLAAGSAVAIEGETSAFVVAFVWNEDTSTGSQYYLVTSNTTSLSIPNPADTVSENFTGWTYLAPAAQQGGDAEIVTVSKASGSNTTVQLDKINQTTIVSAIWTPKSYIVSFNPDNGSATTSVTRTYGEKVTQPANPTRSGYEFAGWVLASNAVEMIGDKTMQFSAGTAFDFANTKIINNLSLKAKWRHVHSYVCLQLDNAAFGGAFSDFYGYKGQLHVKICTSMDDYSVEAHNFVNGKCACGASVLDNKVSLTKYVGASKSQIDAIKNSFVSLSAPQKQNGKVFSKWQYSVNSTDGQNGTWYDLTTMSNASFAIPANMSAKAVYDYEKIVLTVNSFKYDNTHVAFQFNYSVPDGYTVVDGGLMLGDNVRMKFWDCTIKSFLGSQYEPSLRDAVSVFGGGTIASKMYNYQTINEPGLAMPLKKSLNTFGKTGTVAVAWQPYTSAAYSKALNTNTTIKGYDQTKYPTYAMGYIICKHNGVYVGFMTKAISATLANPTKSDVTTISVSS